MHTNLLLLLLFNWHKAPKIQTNLFRIVCSLLKKLKQQAKEQIEERRPNLVKALKQMGDFYMELKWDFQSWGNKCLS